MRFTSSSKFLLKFLVLSVFIFSTNAFSQEQEKDSLDQYSFPELNSKFNKVLYQDSNLAKLYVTKMLHNSIKEGDSFKTAWSYNNFAHLENQIGNIQSSIEYIDKAITIASKKSEGTQEDQEFEIQLIYTKSNIYFGKGEFEKAFEFYAEAYEYYKNTGNKYMMNAIGQSMTLIKNNLGDHTSAIKYLLESYNSYKNASQSDRKKDFSEDFETSVLVGLCDAFLKKAIKYPENKTILLDSASIYNTLGFEKIKKTKDVVGSISFYITRGIIKEERGDYKEAIKDLDISLKYIKEFNQPNLLTAVYYHKGLCFKKLKQFDDAIIFLEKTDYVSQKNSVNYPILQGAYYSLAEIYKDKKDFENVSKYQNLYIENDRINERLTGTVREDIHEKYDLDRLSLEIENLNKTHSKSIIIIGLLVMSIGVFFLFYRKQKQKNKVAFEKLLKQLEDNTKSKTITSKPSKVVSIDDEKVVLVLKALEKFEEKEWFRNKNCDLAFVAKKAKTNKTYLSKIIHTHKQQKFIDYIRSLRIDYALKRLKDDPIFRSYDIKSIAEESGFKSSDLFSRAFVKNTGIYPSYYIKNINKINSSKAI